MGVAFSDRVMSTKPVTLVAMKWRTVSSTSIVSTITSASASDTTPRRPPHNVTAVKSRSTRCPGRTRFRMGMSTYNTTARIANVAAPALTS